MCGGIVRKIRNFCYRFLLGSSLITGLLILRRAVVYDVGDYSDNVDLVVKLQRTKINPDQYVRPTSEDSERPRTHPLENSCKYAVLHPEEESIQRFVKHIRKTECALVQPEMVQFGDDGILRIDRQFNGTVKCMYRSFAGALKPHITILTNFSRWTEFLDKSDKIYDDQIEVQCFEMNETKLDEKNALFRFAFAQIAERRDKNFTANSDTLLSLDMIVLDSTSLNMMRRHMPATLDYWLNNMGALHLEGYHKVADNSMVNLLPILAGKRYGNQASDWPSEYPLNIQLSLETVPFIWKEFEAKGCATMFNDDPMHFTRGLFHYPWELTKGFVDKPTDYYTRPWHVYHRKKPVGTNSSQFCFGNHPYYQLQLRLVEQMITRYKDKCHFSFSFFTDLPHDNPSNLEQMDDTLRDFLIRLRDSNALNRTVLIIMGDHGHRIAAIMYTFVGRIEERTPFFSVYFPEWFRRIHPDIIARFRLNKNRFTSNYDVHQMLKDIINAKFDSKPDKRYRGISLFQDIPSNRSCRDAHVPEHHCACLIKDITGQLDDNTKAAVRHVILTYTKTELANYSYCSSVSDVELLEAEILTTSQMIQHGMRNLEPIYFEKMKHKYLTGDIEYIQSKYRLVPTDVEAVVRLQHDKKTKKMFVNVPPLVIVPKTGASCSDSLRTVPEFCTCSR